VIDTNKVPQVPPVSDFEMNFADFLATFHPDSTDRLSTGKRKPLPEPRPYQVEAIKNVISGFQTASRGQLIMACATGKTLTCLWVKEDLKAQRTVVFVPSLGLLSQILNEWTPNVRQPFDVVCVCSDKSVGERDYDECVIHPPELGYPVTTDPAEIARFLRRDINLVIFSTYQSSPRIAAAQSERGVPHFDLVVADEAHRCAGKVDNAFGTVLDEKLIKSKRRLFATATPRIYTTRIKKNAKESGYEVVDMGDEKRFGKPLHTLTFEKAINYKPNSLLTDYQVVVVAVDDADIKEWIDGRYLVKTDTGLQADAKSLAVQTGLLKAIEKYNLHRIIAYHGRIRRSEKFTQEITQVAEWLPNEHKPKGKLWAEHVSGEMPTDERRRILKWLENVGPDEVGIVSNAKCLQEGIDVPALDGIIFNDPKYSEIDIIQCVGRALRLSKNKTKGFILIPVFVGQTDDVQAALETSDFKPVWDVLNALKSHDDRLIALDRFRSDLGAGRKRKIGDLPNVVFDFDFCTLVDTKKFAESIRTRLVENTTEPWMFMYGLLQAYVKKHGDCLVSQRFKTKGYQLGFWVSNQRARKDTLDPEQRQLLESLPGWTWRSWEDKWKAGFSYLEKFIQQHEHSRVPQTYKIDGYLLGQWVSNQRAQKDTMDDERRKRLESLPKWSWCAGVDKWEDKFSLLKKFAKQEGHCLVPQFYEIDGVKLGVWVNNLRRNKDSLSVDRRRRLESLPHWSWNPRSDRWPKGFSYFKEFVEQEGHCLVPNFYKTKDNYPLGVWLESQKQLIRENKMPSDRKAFLEPLLKKYSHKKKRNRKKRV
jgi:superfamily II DNA or RNA helicase